MIKVVNIDKSFDKKSVINNMNFQFEPGTIFGLVGINGAGKSTLLRLLSGVLNPDYGDIYIDDVNIKENEEIKKNMFYLSDDPPYSNFTTLNDLRGLYQEFYDFDDEVFIDILNMFNLEDKKPISKFSKGMRRQGFIALAFATKAKYLLFDEVFDGLDPQARLKFKQIMIAQQNKEQIIVITSHSLRELEDICDSFGIIDGGTFNKYGQLDLELSRIKKYQIILKDLDQVVNLNNLKTIYQKQEGRVLTVIFEDLENDLSHYLNFGDYLAIDEIPMSFEEYFIVNQGGV